MIGYYDYVLGLIPAGLIGVSGSLNAAGVSSTVAIPAGAIAALVPMCHALFVRGPSSDAVGTSTTPVDSVTSSGSANSPGSINSPGSANSPESVPSAGSPTSAGSD